MDINLMNSLRLSYKLIKMFELVVGQLARLAYLQSGHFVRSLNNKQTL